MSQPLARALALALTLAAPSTAAASEAPPPWRAQVNAALLTVETSWQSHPAILVADGRRALTVDLFDTGRPLTVHRDAAPDRALAAEARVTDGPSPLWDLTLEAPLGPPGVPLAATAPAVGDTVWLVATPSPSAAGDAAAELGETRVTAVTPTRFTIAAPNLLWRDASPVFNAAGELLGLLTYESGVVRVDTLAAPAELNPRGTSVLPLVGIRLGGETGGLLDGAFVYQVDAGLTLWDRLSLVAQLGFAAGGAPGELAALEATDAHGPGGVITDATLGLRLGFEARYRFYLGGGDLPLYFDLAAGMQYTVVPSVPSTLALVSGDAGCDPLVEACALQITDTPELPDKTAFSPAFGADLRWGTLVLGYRYLPDVGHGPAAHQFTLGAAAF